MNSPLPSIAYLKGFVEKNNPGLKIRNIYWNQIIWDRCVLEIKPLLIENIGDEGETGRSFFNSLFAYIFANHHKGLHKHLEIIEKYGALYLVNHSVMLFKDIANKVDVLIEAEIKRLNLDQDHIVGSSIHFHQLIPSLTFLQRIKSKNHKVITIAGGMDQKEAELILKAFPFVDVCVFGEGEKPLLKICEQYPNIDLDNCSGTAWRKKDKIILNQKTAPVENINSIYADYTGFDWKLFKEVTLPIWDSRGCYWQKCKFCEGYHEAEGCFRERSPSSVVSEIRHHLERHPELAKKATDGSVVIMFMGDDARGSTNERFIKLLKGLKKIKMKYGDLGFSLWLSPVYVSDEMMLLLNELGPEIQFGFEQWCDIIVKAMAKKHRVVQGVFTLKLAEKYPLLRIGGFNLLCGFPGETLQDVYSTQNTLFKLRFILASLIRNEQIEEPGLDPFELGIYRSSPLGMTWDYKNAFVKENIKRQPLTRLLCIMSGNEDIAEEIRINYAPFAMYDITATQHLGILLARRLYDRFRNIRINTYFTAKETLFLEVIDIDNTKQIELDDKIYLEVLHLTKGIIAKEKLQQNLFGYRAKKIEKCLNDLEELGLLYSDSYYRYINTIPYSIQQSIDSILEKWKT